MTPHLVPTVSHVECVMPGSGVETIAAHPPPPVPPPPVEAQGGKAAEQPQQPQAPHDDFDLPPPPPPEELEADIIYAKTMVNVSNGTGVNVTAGANTTSEDIVRQKDNTSTGLAERRKMGSVVETHAGIIANLNAKFAATGGPNSPPILGKPPAKPPSVAPTSPQPQMSHSQSSESDTTPTADNPPPGPGMLSQIQRGMSLRRTVTNDRSAPKLN